MEKTPELNVTCRALLQSFLQSEDAASREPSPWLLSFLDAMSIFDWPTDELDKYGLNAALFDGMGWTIDAAPEDPAAVARELLAFLQWAACSAHVERTPEYEECLAYLASPEAARDIGEWLVPIAICWHDSSDPSCDRCGHEGWSPRATQ